MSECDRPHATIGRCAPPSSDNVGSEEGKWVGVCIAIWIVIAVVIWLIRTCISPVRRQQALNRIRCIDKPEEIPPPEVVPEIGAPPMYYTLWPPPSYEEALERLQVMPAYKAAGDTDSPVHEEDVPEDLNGLAIQEDLSNESHTVTTRSRSVSLTLTEEPGHSRAIDSSGSDLSQVPPSTSNPENLSEQGTAFLNTCEVSYEDEGRNNDGSGHKKHVNISDTRSCECGHYDECNSGHATISNSGPQARQIENKAVQDRHGDQNAACDFPCDDDITVTDVHRVITR